LKNINTKNRILFGLLALALLALAAWAIFSHPLFAQSPDYKIQPSDVLNITVYQQPDLTTKTRVSADGYITFPLLGKVYCLDMPADVLALKLKEFLEKDYLVNAQVSVFIEQYHPRQVTVLGEVVKPGRYDMPAEKKITLMDAIALAGGFTKDAALNNTTVLRTENGKEKVIRVRVKDITIKGQKADDVILEPGDIVNIPESFF